MFLIDQTTILLQNYYSTDLSSFRKCGNIQTTIPMKTLSTNGPPPIVEWSMALPLTALYLFNLCPLQNCDQGM